MSLTLLANHDYFQCYVSSNSSLFLINSKKQVYKSIILDYKIKFDNLLHNSIWTNYSY